MRFRRHRQQDFDFNNAEDIEFLTYLAKKTEKNEHDLDSIGRFLKDSALFSHLSSVLPSQLMRKIFAGFRFVQFLPNSSIFAESDLAETLFVCLEGSACAYNIRTQTNELNSRDIVKERQLLTEGDNNVIPNEEVNVNGRANSRNSYSKSNENNNNNNNNGESRNPYSDLTANEYFKNRFKSKMESKLSQRVRLEIAGCGILSDEKVKNINLVSSNSTSNSPNEDIANHSSKDNKTSIPTNIIACENIPPNILAGRPVEKDSQNTILQVIQSFQLKSSNNRSFSNPNSSQLEHQQQQEEEGEKSNNQLNQESEEKKSQQIESESYIEPMVVARYGAGSVFGEECLKNDYSVRKQWVIASSDGIGMSGIVLHRKFFENAVMSLYELNLEKEIAFLKTNAVFNALQDEEYLQLIALNLKTEHFKSHAVIFKEEQPANKIYLVLAGEIQIERVIQKNESNVGSVFESPQKSQSPLISMSNSPSNQNTATSRQKIAIVGVGEMFGESEVLKRIPRASCATAIRSENACYVFDMKQLRMLFRFSGLKESLVNCSMNKSGWRYEQLDRIQRAQANQQRSLDTLASMHSQQQLQQQQVNELIQKQLREQITLPSLEFHYHNPTNSSLNQQQQHSMNSLSSLTNRHNYQSQRQHNLNEQSSFLLTEAAIGIALSPVPAMEQSSPSSQRKLHHASNPISDSKSRGLLQIIDHGASSHNPLASSSLPRIIASNSIRITPHLNETKQQQQQQQSNKLATQKTLILSPSNFTKDYSTLDDPSASTIEINQQRSSSILSNQSRACFCAPRPRIGAAGSLTRNRIQSLETNASNGILMQPPSLVRLNRISSKDNIQQSQSPPPPFYNYPHQQSKGTRLLQPNISPPPPFKDTLMPLRENSQFVLENSLLLLSPSKSHQKSYQRKRTNSKSSTKDIEQLLAERRRRPYFIYENEELASMYEKCKYQHAVYEPQPHSNSNVNVNCSQKRKEKKKQSMNLSQGTSPPVTPINNDLNYSVSIRSNSPESTHLQLPQLHQPRGIIAKNNRENDTNQGSLAKMDASTVAVIAATKRKQMKELQDMVRKSTSVEVKYFSNSQDLSLSTNVSDKMAEQKTRKFRFNAMKQIILSSDLVSSISFLSKSTTNSQATAATALTARTPQSTKQKLQIEQQLPYFPANISSKRYQ